VLPLLLALACTPAPPPTPPRAGAVPPVVTPTAVALGRLAPVALELPPSSRPAPVPDQFHPSTGFSKGGVGAGWQTWHTPLPVHPNLFPTRQAGARAFGYYAPPDVTVLYRGRPLRFERGAGAANTWAYDHQRLLIGTALGTPPPRPEDVTILWPRAAAADRTLHLDTSGREPAAFALREVTLDAETMSGVLLPAPASATWSVTVPPSGALSLRASILPPAVASEQPSDGATLRARVTATGATADVGQPIALRPGADAQEVRFDLSKWAGQTVQLQLATEPGTTAWHDLVFLEEPTLYTPSANPRRMVLLYIDTVRRDHLGMYGYARDTTPKLDAWATTALRLDDARTIAPWTLPSARAALTGAQPERWYALPNLPARLASAGWYTDGYVGNGYLSPVFDMGRGFAHYRYDHLAPATKVVDHALDVLGRYPDRDVLVYAQFMTAHLPYNEPERYRGLWAGDKPDHLSSVARIELIKYAPDDRRLPEVRQHVIDRYDQNLRYLDDELARLLATLPPDVTVAIFSDHGEEFWDHGGYEHGHSFYDELLRVPVLLYDPNLPNGVLTEPTSLLDLAPTLLQLAGLPSDAEAGRSLLPAALGDDAARAALQDRGVAFGRPLYGTDGWGVVHGGAKWWSRGGEEWLFDLASDAAEASGAPTADPSHAAAATAALGHELVRAWRLSLENVRNAEPVELRITHPGGLKAAWRGYDPRAASEGVEVKLVDGAAVILADAGEVLPDLVYLQPAGDPLDATGLTLIAKGRREETASYTGARLVDGPGREAFLGPVHPRFGATVDLAWVPPPFGRSVGGAAPELAQQLKELGYMD
jgi:arylsulfatase A-like enzyme